MPWRRDVSGVIGLALLLGPPSVPSGSGGTRHSEAQIQTHLADTAPPTPATKVRQQLVATAMWKERSAKNAHALAFVSPSLWRWRGLKCQETWIHVRGKAEEHRAELERVRNPNSDPTPTQHSSPNAKARGRGRGCKVPWAARAERGRSFPAPRCPLCPLHTFSCGTPQAAVASLQRQLDEARSAYQLLEQGSHLVTTEAATRHARLEEAQRRSWRVAAGKLNRFMRRGEAESHRRLLQGWFDADEVQAIRYARMQKEWRREQGLSPCKV